MNIAAFRSLILVLAACQLGSRVEALALLKLMGRGEAKGEVGVLLEGGCVIWMTSPDDGPPTTPPPPPPPWLSTYTPMLGVGLFRPTHQKKKEREREGTLALCLFHAL